MIIVLLVILSFLHFNLLAASVDLTTGEAITFTSAQVPFFKSPESLFPSGVTSVQNLSRNQIEQTFKPEVFYKYQGILYSKEMVKPLLPNHLSQFVIETKTLIRWSVLEAKVDHLLAFDSKSKQTREFNVLDVHPDPYDKGFAMTLKDVFLKNEASETSKTLTTISAGSRFLVLHFKKGFAQVSYRRYIGYIAMSELITKFDFATSIFSGGRWHFVRSRDFDWMITTENKRIHLNQVQGIVTPESIGLIASKNQRIPLWSRVEVEIKNKKSWIQSRLKEHGLIWWKPSSISSEKIFTIDELLKKEIASISFHPKNPLKAILSSHGVYSTEDGYHWKELPAFKNFHGPVHYFNDLMIFVGNYRSLDQGKTFENYIQIDRLTAAIQSQFGFLPKKLQVKKIDTFPPYQLKLEIDTGSQKIRMQSPLFAQSWMAVKS